MATQNFGIQTKIDELRHEILSYEPANGLQFGSGKLVIGLVDLGQCGSSTASALRRALHGSDAQKSQNSDVTSLEKEEHLTNSISVVSIAISCRHNIITRDYMAASLQELALRVGFLVLLMRASLVPYFTTECIKLIQQITGCPPISIIVCDTRRPDIDMLKEYLRRNNITDIYEIPDQIQLGCATLANEEQLELLRMLQQCLIRNDEFTTLELSDALREICNIR